jgi:ectoine hydroxylase-related dioxygenase (phytanoyl-CoA dioxygenase family)
MAAPVVSQREADWLTRALEGLRCVGYAIVENVLDAAFVEKTRRAMYDVQAKIVVEIGVERLARAGELGVLRLMPQYDPHFFAFLEIPELLAVVDRTVSETAIMHLQNGFILPSFPKTETPSIFQNNFHRDFPRVFNGYLASVNVMFAIDAFSATNGATLVVPGTHQKIEPPDPDYMAANAVPVECPSGSMFVFDSTLWHAAGANVSGHDRLAINHQFTRSFFKQQIDYVRALGDETVLAQKSRTQQLLGWYTRVVTSLDEYYRPEDERIYRKGQG